ncbi:hypothetical protein [Comamonas sp. JC664]|uniref:hypothetical protein n=1 Tax=Comamonas sp. JC664 TaxID=2801917 RepID=UPI00191DFDD6|nr:hypothetical protein [Comamonas sp. JC664]MBL0692371.1 hypothetical protein [Comamonas sp. JC664]
MGKGWAWVGMLGLCALASGCREREPRADITASSNIEANTADGVATATPVTGVRGRTGNAAIQPATAVPERTPVMNATAQAPSDMSARAAPLEGAPVRAPAPVDTMTARNDTARANAGRVMIGSAAVQASEDEDWYLGAARAAQDASQPGTGGSGSADLEEVIIASSSVSGRVTRVKQNTITVKDREGDEYELELDRGSRGLRQGRKVPLRQLKEGTPVRAQFVLMGGRTVARDVQIRR